MGLWSFSSVGGFGDWVVGMVQLSKFCWLKSKLFCCSSYPICTLMPKVISLLIIVIKLCFLCFSPQEIKIRKFWRLTVNIPHKASSASTPPHTLSCPSSEHNMKEFLGWFGCKPQLLSHLRGFAGGWSFPTALTRRGGMQCWRHSRSWECFAFLFLAVVRWLPARMKDNSFQKWKKREEENNSL